MSSESRDREPASVVLDNDLPVRAKAADGAGGYEFLTAIAESANATVSRATYQEFVGIGKYDDLFVEVGAYDVDGPSEEMQAAWKDGKIAVVDEVAVDLLDEDLREEVERRFDVRLSDGLLDLDTYGSSDQGYDDTGSTEAVTERASSIDGLSFEEFMRPDENKLTLDVRDGPNESERELGAGESGGILLADAMEGRFVGNDRNARATARDVGVDTAEFYASTTELVGTGVVERSAADEMLDRLDDRDQLPRDPMGDAPDEEDVTLRTVLDNLPDDVTREMFDADEKTNVDPVDTVFDEVDDTEATDVEAEVTDDLFDTEPPWKSVLTAAEAAAVDTPGATAGGESQSV